jgi:hypothetical protein
MKDIRGPVLFTSIYLLVYVIALSTGVYYDLAFLMFMFSQVLVVWMVYYVLKFGTPSSKKFDDGHWYEDHDVNAYQETDDKIDMIGF